MRVPGLRRLLVGWAVPVVFAGALGLPAGAVAHEGDPNIDTLIAGLRPAPIAGVDLEVVEGIVPALSALNRSGRELEVLDQQGTPFLRIGPRGAEGNAAATAFYRSAAPGGAARVPPGLGRTGVPARWVLLSHRPAWAWYDQRVPDVTVAPPSVRASSGPTQLASFSIPLRYGSEAVIAQGAVTYVPPRARPLARLTSPAQPAPGVRVALLAGDRPDLYLQNAGPQTLTILGEQGEPFAQIGPQGVRVNLRSSIHAADAAARGEPVRTPVNPAAPPLWRRVSTSPAYDWLDPRPRLQAQWMIPMLLGRERLALSGTRSPSPAPISGRRTAAGPQPRRGAGNGEDTGVLIAVAAAALAALGGLGLVFRGRRRRAQVRT